MSKILITGSRGFVGKHLVRYLKDRYEIVEIDREIGSEVLDLRPSDLDGVEAVFHLAAQTSVWNEDDRQILADNVAGFAYLLSLCKGAGVRLIYASSSCSVNVTSMYGLSKSVCDEIAERFGWEECVGLRLHNVYGKDARSDTLLGRCLSDNFVKLFNLGNNFRHFTYIDDVCRAFESGLKLKGGIYNVANPKGNFVWEMVREVQKYKNLNVAFWPEPREKDKVVQQIDGQLKNLLEKGCVQIEEGIKLVFS